MRKAAKAASDEQILASKNFGVERVGAVAAAHGLCLSGACRLIERAGERPCPNPLHPERWRSHEEMVALTAPLLLPAEGPKDEAALWWEVADFLEEERASALEGARSLVVHFSDPSSEENAKDAFMLRTEWARSIKELGGPAPPKGLNLEEGWCSKIRISKADADLVRIWVATVQEWAEGLPTLEPALTRPRSRWASQSSGFDDWWERRFPSDYGAPAGGHPWRNLD